jgi:hypothetical protein
MKYILNSNTKRIERDRPPDCVIAQQYSSATFVPLHFHPTKENPGALKNVITSVFLIFC